MDRNRKISLYFTGYCNWWRNCEMIQLSTQIFRMVQHNSKLTSEIERECFDEYIMPSKDSIWDERLFQIHGLYRDHPRIKATDDITEVWHRFCIYVCKHIGNSQKGIVKFYAISHLFVYILTYKYTNTSFTLYFIRL